MAPAVVAAKKVQRQQHAASAADAKHMQWLAFMPLICSVATRGLKDVPERGKGCFA